MNISTTLRRFAVFAFVLAALSGCATIEGMGEDVENAGDQIEDATDNR
ncbi:entericidin A/B family lipoprotein [Aliiglaciecola litoralis]|uniref:Entericidin A/B family lipoprotein n=1 Tax=Aliiglaciecola litoralis TaxID=582857 RepID=A0ABN1LRF9_9ALTE